MNLKELLFNKIALDLNKKKKKRVKRKNKIGEIKFTIYI